MEPDFLTCLKRKFIWTKTLIFGLQPVIFQRVYINNNVMSSVLVGTEFLMPSAVEMPKLAQSHLYKFTTLLMNFSQRVRACVYVLRLLWKTSFDLNLTWISMCKEKRIIFDSNS